MTIHLSFLFVSVSYSPALMDWHWALLLLRCPCTFEGLKQILKLNVRVSCLPFVCASSLVQSDICDNSNTSNQSAARSATCLAQCNGSRSWGKNRHSETRGAAIKQGEDASNPDQSAARKARQDKRWGGEGEETAERGEGTGDPTNLRPATPVKGKTGAEKAGRLEEGGDWQA